jgi:MFS transporter, FHS family, glucose/mannose:H+ symporter
MASSVSVPKRLPVATDGVALIHADFLITGIVMTFIGPMLPILAARWSLADAVSGRLYLTQFVSSMFGMLLSAPTVQRRGYRFTFIVGILFMAVGMSLLASGSFSRGIIAVAILGFGHGITTPAGNLRTADVSAQRSASALNVVNAVWGIGAMSSPFLVAIALRYHHPAYFLYGTVGALMLLLLALLLTRFVPDTHGLSEPTLVNKSLWSDRALPLICLLFFIYVGTETSFGAWIATYARRVDSRAHALATVTPSFYWGALLLGRALAPIFLKFRSAVTIARMGLAIGMLGGITLVAQHEIKLVVVGAILAGLGLASIFPISVSLFPRWFGPSVRRVSGAVFASGNIGGAVVPWLVGEISSHTAGLRVAFLVPLLGISAMLFFYLSNNASIRRFAKAEAADLLLN